jgi:hypothetical protein
VLGFTCATNVLPPGREAQAERPGTLPAYRVRCKPLLEGVRVRSIQHDVAPRRERGGRVVLSWALEGHRCPPLGPDGSAE